MTARDRQLIEDIALHHVMTSDQVVALGYFTSSSRANRRLLTLVKAGLLERVMRNPSCDTRRALYRASKRAGGWIDQRVAYHLASRRISLLQLDHSLAVVDTRIKLKQLGFERWLAEPQCRHCYTVNRGGRKESHDFRPDGIARRGETIVFVEVDRGTVSLPRIKAKLDGYALYVRTGMLAETYGNVQPSLLVATTGSLRRQHLLQSIPAALPLPVIIHTGDVFRTLGAAEQVAQ